MELVPESGERPVIIGAGPGGIAVAWTLKAAGLNPIVLDREKVACSSWNTYYPSLRMNSWRRVSHFPGRKLPAEYGPWPMRNDFINFMKKYVKDLDADIRFGTEVHRVDRDTDADRWVVRTSIGDLPAQHVIVATGLHRRPHVPAWPGLDEFAGEFLHARDYMEPDAYVGKDCLVVGCGPSGIDIAIELARSGAKRVRLSVRHTPILLTLSPATSLLSQAVKHGPFPTWLVNKVSLMLHRIRFGDLTEFGLAAPKEGVLAGTARSGHAHGSIDRGLIPALREGSVSIVPGVTGFDKKAVLLDGETSITPDVVISATGQRPEMEGLLGHLDVLSQPGGRPLVFGAKTAPHAPNLYFQGYRLPPGQLPDMSVDAKAIARAIAGGRLRRALRSR